MSDLETLLALQERDSAIDRLQYRRDNCPERAELAAVLKGISDLDARREDNARRRGRIDAAQREAEADLATANGRIDTLEKQLYAGTVSAAKDLQAMAHEVAMLKERRSGIEDRALEVMEEAELAGAEEAELSEARQSHETKAAELRAAIAEVEREIDVEIEEERRRRAEVAGSVPGDLTARYEALRARLGGMAVARLAGGRCEGCHLSLSAVALDRIRHAPEGTIETCEECGRILVPC